MTGCVEGLVSNAQMYWKSLDDSLGKMVDDDELVVLPTSFSLLLFCSFLFSQAKGGDENRVCALGPCVLGEAGDKTGKAAKGSSW